MTFAHQSLGDLNKVSPEFKDIIIENTNNKIILKINDPESADFFASYIGTNSTEKVTERQSRGFIGTQKSGEQSVRETEEFIVHPNVFKSELSPGDAVAIITNPSAPRKIERIKCERIRIDSYSFLPPKIVHKEMTFINEAKRFTAVKKDTHGTTQNNTAAPPQTTTPPVLAVSQEMAANKVEGKHVHEQTN